MRAILFLSAAAFVLTGCVTTSTTEAFPEHYQSSQCFAGGYAFTANVAVPREYGRVLALTQHRGAPGNLTTVCRLDGTGGAFSVYTGEIAGSGVCVSARTQNAGHVMSCASTSEVRRATRAGIGAWDNVIDFDDWRTYSG